MFLTLVLDEGELSTSLPGHFIHGGNSPQY